MMEIPVLTSVGYDSLWLHMTVKKWSRNLPVVWF
jgi:hypothetical protein